MLLTVPCESILPFVVSTIVVNWVDYSKSSSKFNAACIPSFMKYVTI